MKAIIRKTGQTVDICKWKSNPDASCAGNSEVYYDMDGNSYYNEELDFISGNIDWEQRKYEIVKTVIPISIERQYEVLKKANELGYRHDYVKESIEWAVDFANTLIKKLQDEHTNERRGNTGIQ